MSRVWKRTLWKLATLFGTIIGFIAYGIGCFALGKYVFNSPEGGLFGGFAGGFLVFVVYEAHKMAKFEIEYENEKLMRQLKTDELKKKLFP